MFGPIRRERSAVDETYRLTGTNGFALRDE